MSGIQLPDCSKLTKNRENDNGITICRNDVIKFFDVVLFLWSSLVTGRSFMLISSITGSGVMTIFFYWKLEIPPSVLCSISGNRRVRDIKLGTNISNKMFLNAAKCQGYSFCRFWVIKGKPTGGGLGGEGEGGKITPLPGLGLKTLNSFLKYFSSKNKVNCVRAAR